MTNYKTIGADEAWQKARTNSAVLVNSYDNDQDVAANAIPGATPFLEFKAEAAKLPKDTEISFYCACPDDELATQRAQEFAQLGFTNVKVVEGGYKALAVMSKAQSQKSAAG